MNSSKVGNPLSSIKATNLVLIPKVSSLYSASDIRPIARSNVVCKCMSHLWCLRIRLMGVLLYYSSESRSFCAGNWTRPYSRMLCHVRINQGTTVERREIAHIPQCYFMSRYEQRLSVSSWQKLTRKTPQGIKGWPLGIYLILKGLFYLSLCSSVQLDDGAQA